MKSESKGNDSTSNDSARPPEFPSRREFIGRCAGMLGGFTLIGVVAPVLTGCEPTSTGPVNTGGNTGGTSNGNTVVFDVAALVNVGDALATTSKGPDGFTIMLTRLSATEFAALSMRCTHESCIVDDTPQQNGPITCFCHGSRFGLDGAVINGPAAAPLKRYAATHDATTNKLTVTLA